LRLEKEDERKVDIGKVRVVEIGKGRSKKVERKKVEHKMSRRRRSV